jgi:hypothetical protein
VRGRLSLENISQRNTSAARRAGAVYVDRILRGARPAELPVQLASTS